MNKFTLKLIKFNLIIILGFCLSTGAWLWYKNYQYFKNGENIVYKSGEVLGISSIATIINIDYSNQITIGHPEIFGGAHGPSLLHPAAWDMLSNIGVTSIRRDFYIDYEAPQNTTIDKYLANENNIQDPKNWNTKKIDETQSIYQNTKNRGLKTIGIIAYAPKWLTFTNTSFGVPKNWDIFEDIVGKLYKIHRPYLDYIEIWNEPDLQHFLDIKDSGLTREDAYLQIFIHASKAIRSVDKEIGDGKNILIGGGVTSNPIRSIFIEKILQNEEAKNYLGFVSYHAYGYDEPSWSIFKSTLKKYKVENIPIFLTEWNKNSDEKKDNQYNNSPIAISYTGSKFIQYLKMGLNGANYFSTTFSNSSRPNSVFSVFGIYTISNNNIKPFPQTKTWQVLSKSAKLGAGDSTVVSTTYDEDSGIDAVGFINSNKERGFAISNPTNNTYSISVNISGLPEQNKVVVTAYQASEDSDPKVPKKIKIDWSNRNEIQVISPPLSVSSVIF